MTSAHKRTKRGGVLPAAGVLIVGIILTLLTFDQWRDRELFRITETFNRDAVDRVTAIQLEVDETLEVLHHLEALRASSEAVTWNEFEIFATSLLDDLAATQALEWVPRVPRAERLAYERAAEAEGLIGFRITERSPEGEMVPVSDRDEYFPGYFVVPLEGNEAAVGFDLGSSASQFEALNKARDTGEAVATEGITLVQEPDRQFGFLLILPAYAAGSEAFTAEERHDALEGFIVGVFHVADLIEAAIGTLTPMGVHIDVFDVLSPEESQLLYHHIARLSSSGEKAHTLSPEPDRGDLVFVGRIEVGGRVWSIECSSSAAYISTRRQSAVWWILASGLFLSGTVASYLWSSARKTAQRERAQKERGQIAEEMRLFIDTANAPIFGIDVDGKVTEWNTTAAAITGFSKDEVIGHDLVEEYISEEYRASVEEVLDEALEGRETPNYELPLYTRDGQRVLVLLNASARRDVDGKVIGVIGIGQDITELDAYRRGLEKLVEERTLELNAAVEMAEAANRVKSEFLANMSHELRTPMNAILGFSQVLEERYFGELTEKQAEYVSDILGSGRHLLALINDILDLAKIEAGKMKLDLCSTGVAELIERSTVMIREKCLQHGITLSTEIAEEVADLTIEADERKLRQVLFNLLSNAAKFTPDGGSITVRAERTGEELVIRVIDTGIGVAPEEQGRIFEPFHQVQSGSADKTPGTGLGLQLSRSFIELHGGRIWVESEGLGKGSTFSFALPLRNVGQQEGA